MLRPNIYGWRLAAGAILWVEAAALLILLTLQVFGGEEQYSFLPLAPAAIIWIGLSAAFWRGSTLARWLGLIPATLTGFSALAFWALSSICTSSLVVALSCAPGPLPPVSPQAWLIRVALIGVTGLVVAGVLLPGRIAERDGLRPAADPDR